jgi:hypothetical protein
MLCLHPHLLSLRGGISTSGNALYATLCKEIVDVTVCYTYTS